MVLAKSLIFIDLFNPEAKKPPNGEITEANEAIIRACIVAGEMKIYS